MKEMIKECPRCGGYVLKDYEELLCINCGWRPIEVVDLKYIPYRQETRRKLIKAK